jgi:predicted ATPase with chaperone activity
VAGNHNLLLVGPPGSGKSMIAKRIPTIMPEPHLDEFLEMLSIHSAAGHTLNGELRTFARPFRAPHHTISDVGISGGGTIPGPARSRSPTTACSSSTSARVQALRPRGPPPAPRRQPGLHLP